MSEVALHTPGAPWAPGPFAVVVVNSDVQQNSLRSRHSAALLCRSPVLGRPDVFPPGT